ncbi:MAG: hypothetical protein FWC76_04480 [Defluviitaleaceae bacterium]|nr:hypothetical protein [Defluviitaleaceae bacterium]
MEKLMSFVMPMKFIAGGVLAGLVGFYMVVGTIYARLTGAEFEYSIPFAFILQGVVLAIAIAILWEVFFGEKIIKKWRFFKRALVFNLSLILLIAICFLTSFALPTNWAYLWLIGVGIIALGIAVMSGLSEIYYRKTGEHYNEMLRIYQEKQGISK